MSKEIFEFNVLLDERFDVRFAFLSGIIGFLIRLWEARPAAA